jgi:hypothetical protein
VFLTDVTVEEVKANIREEVEISVQKHQSFLAKSKILHNSSSADVKVTLAKLDGSALVNELVGQFEAFLKVAKATILKAGELKAGPILENYFSQKPPFGKGKKKSEFPDAFVIEALRGWCSKEKSELYVVSGDGDMQGACDKSGPLYSLPRLADFLDSLSSDLEEETTAFVRAQIIKRKGEIMKRITKDFPDRGFTITDVADFHSNVDDVSVTHVDLQDDDFEVIEVSDGSATITAMVRISYEAYLIYGNEDTAAWDHEDGYFFIDTVNKTVELENESEVQITAVFDDLDPDSFQLDEVDLDAPDTIYIHAHDDGGWPYK